MDIRKFNNLVKRQLIDSVVQPNYTILDVGCGQGGDIFKWLGHDDVTLYACDPNKTSIEEAKRRVSGKPGKYCLFTGDITAVPKIQYDIICYNFSLQYIFESRELFKKTIECIRDVSKINTKIVGIIPDSDFIGMQTPTYVDQYNNSFSRASDCLGDFGEKIWVNVEGAPYYKNGPIAEPIAYKDVLITHLANIGFVLEYWRPLTQMPTGCITDMYSEFVFVRENV
jgi:SAM-dependent methyltransferase